MAKLIAIAIAIFLLGLVVLPRYVQLAERSVVNKAIGNIDVLRKLQLIYYGTNSAYADELDKLTELSGGVIRDLDEDWKYSLSGNSYAYTVTAARRDKVKRAYANKTILVDVNGQVVGGSHPLLRR